MDGKCRGSWVGTTDSCFSLGVFTRTVRVARSELTKKRVVGVERIGHLVSAKNGTELMDTRSGVSVGSLPLRFRKECRELTEERVNGWIRRQIRN